MTFEDSALFQMYHISGYTGENKTREGDEPSLENQNNKSISNSQ